MYYILVIMNKIQNLGDFEQVLLLSVLRLKDDGAYGVSIRKEISTHTKRSPAPGAIYTRLDRLESKLMLKSWSGEATSERGGRAKRFYQVTGTGLNALKQTQQEYQSLMQGLNLFGEAYA